MFHAIAELLEHPTHALFVTGKGGVGKTSLACALAVALADRGRRTLLVSTDPASNLDEVLGVPLRGEPTPVLAAPGLFAMNLDPVAAARAYRERVVGPYRGVLPAAAVASIEEQLSGACTVEIAAFDEFSRLLSDPAVRSAFAHVVFDTAPTGHTLRLLALPAAWTEFLEANAGGTSCLGPLSGLGAQRAVYQATRDALADPVATTIVLVSRPERSSLAEAERTRVELAALGVRRLHLVVNGVFRAADATRDVDPVACALERRGERALAALPPGLRDLPRSDVALLPGQVVGVAAVRGVLAAARPATGSSEPRSSGAGPTAVGPTTSAPRCAPLEALADELASAGHGVVFTMGKGGVGKTYVARGLAEALARRGHSVHLTTTDPAGRADSLEGLRVSRIDPKAEVVAYTRDVLAAAGDLDAAGRALLEEDLRSPCTEEIAVFRALARVVAEGARGFVVIDTAPTGHTVLLLDAAGSYHRDVSRSAGAVPDEVRSLLPRLRDPSFTRVVIVTLPEATPVHEAAVLAAELRRAGIEPHAWVVNQSLASLDVRDPILVARRRAEVRYLDEVRRLASRVVVVPWCADPEPSVEPAPAQAAPARDGLEVNLGGAVS